MRPLSMPCLAGRAAAVLSIAAGLCATSASAENPATTRISGPHVHDNLAIYFVHGPSSAGPVPLTLAEALETAAVAVRETGTVNALEIENTADVEVYIQAGDIVKGGKQDRVLTTSLLLPPKSGRVPIGSYCVEQGRWAARGKEDVKAFASSRDAMPSREAKIAMNRPKAPASAQIEPTPSRVPSYTDQHAANVAQQRRGDNAAGSSRQSEVWAEVAKTQAKLAVGLAASSVAAPESKSSLQLTLENEKLKSARDAYIAALSEKAGAATDVIGYVFAVNGKLNSADVYPSNGLFVKMWPKLLNASITEAIGERASPTNAAIPTGDAVKTFLESAEKGKAEEKALGGLMHREVRDADAALYVEARRLDGRFVHRNYLAK